MITCVQTERNTNTSRIPDGSFNRVIIAELAKGYYRHVKDSLSKSKTPEGERKKEAKKAEDRHRSRRANVSRDWKLEQVYSP